MTRGRIAIVLASLAVMVSPSAIASDDFSGAMRRLAQNCAHLGFEAGQLIEAERALGKPEMISATMAELSGQCFLDKHTVDGWR